MTPPARTPLIFTLRLTVTQGHWKRNH